MEPAQPIVENEHHKIIHFTFAPGQELSEHTASVPAAIHILRGEGAVILDGVEQTSALVSPQFAIEMAAISVAAAAHLTAEGKTPREARRAGKRHLANLVSRRLQRRAESALPAAVS